MNESENLITMNESENLVNINESENLAAEDLMNMPLAEDLIDNKEIKIVNRQSSDKIYIQKFRKEWLYDSKYKDWLCKDENDDTKAFCKFCDCGLLAKLFNIENHRVSKKHRGHEALYNGDLETIERINNSRKKYKKKRLDDSVTSLNIINNSKKVYDKSKETGYTLYIADHCTVKILDCLPILTAEERIKSLQTLLNKEWCLVDGKDAIVKKFIFNSFNQAFAFMTRIAICAEKNDHHPKWINVYNSVEITWSTHASGGLTMKDIKMANFCDSVFDEFNFD